MIDNQRCYRHLCDNLVDKVRKIDQHTIADEFMQLAKYETGKEALEAFKVFVGKWGSKYRSIKNWANETDVTTIFNFYRFHREIRTKIYTNNRIESFNKEIKRFGRAHVQWCTEEAEEKFLVTIFNRYNFKIGKRVIRGKNYHDAELLEL